MEPKEGLQKIVSEIISGFNATIPITTTKTVCNAPRGVSGYDRQMYEEDIDVTEDVPDSDKISEARHRLEELVRDTEPSILAQISEPIIVGEVVRTYGVAIVLEKANPTFLLECMPHLVDTAYVKRQCIPDLLKSPKSEVLEKIGELLGIDATPYFIDAFNEQNDKQRKVIFRSMLSRFGDERSLPVLWQEIVSNGKLSKDHSATRDYLDALARIKGQYEFIRMIVDDRIQPSELRQDARDYFGPGGHTFSAEFHDAFLTVTDLVKPSYFGRPFHDFRLTLMFVEKNPQVLMEIFDHPNLESPRWDVTSNYDPFTRFKHFDAEATIPILIDVVSSDHYPDILRAYAAIELRGRNNPEANKKMLEMMDTPNCRYAAKALTRSAYGRNYKDFARKQPDVWSGTIEAFFSHWSKVDELDWKLTLSSDRDVFEKEMVPRLVGILTDGSQEVELKRRSLDLLINFFRYQSGDYRYSDKTTEYRIPVDEQQRQKILDYVVGEGYKERADFAQLFRKSSFGFENFQKVGTLACDPNQDIKLRLRAINILGESGVQYRDWGRGRDVRNYLKRAGSKLIGKFFEPNEEVRLAVREAYSRIK